MRAVRFVVALTFLGLVFNLVITIDPGSADLSSITTSPQQSPALTPVETVPMATAAAVARAAGTVASGVAGFASSPASSPAAITAQALTSVSGLSAPTAHPTADSIVTGHSMLSRVGASITAVVSGLVPVVPPVLPLNMMRRIAAEATSSSGFSGPEDGSGPAVLILVGMCICGAFSVRRFTDDRARLAWSFVAPLQRPG